MFLKILFGMKAPHKRGVYAKTAELLIMSEQEDNLEVDFMAHLFWRVLYNSCRKFSNLISPKEAQVIYMDPESVRLLGTILGTWLKNWHVTSH